MTSSNGNSFCVTGPLCGESIGHRWIPLIKASDANFLMFSVICAWTNSWVNNQDAGNLRRHRPDYDAIVMSCSIAVLFWTTPCVPHIWLIESYIGVAIGSPAFGNESISLICHLQHGQGYWDGSDVRCRDKFRHSNYDNGYIRLASYTNASADSSANYVRTAVCTADERSFLETWIWVDR